MYIAEFLKTPSQFLYYHYMTGNYFLRLNMLNIRINIINSLTKLHHQNSLYIIVILIKPVGQVQKGIPNAPVPVPRFPLQERQLFA